MSYRDRFAFATFLIRNDAYLPGALLSAYSLRQQQVQASLLCFVTPDVSAAARGALERLYDHVLVVPALQTTVRVDQKRQYLPAVFTRLHALRLGRDGDLGFAFDKVVVLDADILPVRHYQQLFLVDAPAAILNEDAEALRPDADSKESSRHSVWRWHRNYEAYPHGADIPKRITDRVIFQPSNYGMHTGLLVLQPSQTMFEEICEDLGQPDVQAFIRDRFTWPDMQYLTLKWSGAWHNVDLCFAGLYGFPDIQTLFGCHFAGIKPWELGNPSLDRVYQAYPDFRFWYEEYRRMLERHPDLERSPALRRVGEYARAVGGLRLDNPSAQR